MQHEEEKKRLEEEVEKERVESKKEEQEKNKANTSPLGTRLWPESRQPGSSFINSDTQTFTFIKDDNGSTTLTPTVFKRESNSVIPDSNLPFDNFLIAIPHMIEAMGQAQWPKDHILMMSQFQDNILDNPCCSTGLHKDKLTLMVYQEEQCKQWHHMTSVPGQGCDLSEISATLLKLTKSCLLWECHQKDDEAYKAMVSTFSLYKIHISNDNPPEKLPFC